MDAALKQQIDQLHDSDRHEEILRVLEALPEGERDYDCVCLLARACNNLGQEERAAGLLLSVREQGETDPLWHFRLGYAYYYQGREREALPEFQRTLELDPGDPDAGMFLDWCRKAIDAKEREGVERFDPVLYTREEYAAVMDHIERHFGPVENVMMEIVSPDIRVNIAVCPPCEAHDYYVLCTVGMGARRMDIPADLAGKELDRAEVMIALPPDWRVGDGEERWYWPVRWLKILARLPIDQDTWLGWGHTVPAGEPFTENPNVAGVMLVMPGAFGAESFGCKLPGGETVNFYQTITLYDDEMDFKLRNGASALLDYMGDEVMEVIDLHRESVCTYVQVKDYAIPTENIRLMLRSWDGPAGCLATDRILVDGARVGYMYREKPDFEEDSGWRFLAVDETEEYLADIQNSDVYDLNTLCNYDSDILPFLNYPVGSAFERDEWGHFTEIRD